MERPNTTPGPATKPHIVNLAAGGQAVINGALVTATEACRIQVGSGAFVLTGRALWRSRNGLRNPREELYFSMLDAAISDARFEAERFRLFALLSQVVAQDRTHQGQAECTLCARALLAGNSDEAVESAARLAAEAIEPNRRVPGQRSERREAMAIFERARPPVSE